MQLARVIGTVVSTNKEPALEGLKLLVLKVTNTKGEPVGATVIGADAVGAGVGDVVLFATGSSARQTVVTKERPVDAVAMAIVDIVDEEGSVVYHKAEEAVA